MAFVSLNKNPARYKKKKKKTENVPYKYQALYKHFKWSSAQEYSAVQIEF